MEEAGVPDMLNLTTSTHPRVSVLPLPSQESCVRVVVANAAVARFFELSHEGDLRETVSLRNPGNPQPAVQSMAPVDESPFDRAQKRAHYFEDGFALDLCRRLAGLCEDGSGTRLYLLAEEAFMAQMRAHMDAFTHGHVVREIAGDYVGHAASFIRQLLPRRL